MTDELVGVPLEVSAAERGLWARAAAQEGAPLVQWVRWALNAEANSVLPPVKSPQTRWPDVSKPDIRGGK